MQLLATRTNVVPWCHPTLVRLDASLERAGARLLDVAWSECSLEDDGEHFDAEGLDAFAQRLAAAVAAALDYGAMAPTARGPPLVYMVTDSTVGHHGTAGAAIVVAAFAAVGLRLHVDAVCGSGFVRGGCGAPVLPRLTHAWRHSVSPPDTLLLAIGWNDVGATPAHLEAAVARAGATMHRLSRIGGRSTGVVRHDGIVDELPNVGKELAMR